MELTLSGQKLKNRDAGRNQNQHGAVVSKESLHKKQLNADC